MKICDLPDHGLPNIPESISLCYYVATIANHRWKTWNTISLTQYIQYIEDKLAKYCFEIFAYFETFSYETFLVGALPFTLLLDIISLQGLVFWFLQNLIKGRMIMPLINVLPGRGGQNSSFQYGNTGCCRWQNLGSATVNSVGIAVLFENKAHLKLFQDLAPQRISG